MYARYARQISLPEMGIAGQDKLLASSVLICGCGGLGSPAAFYTAAMGVGCIGLVDNDVVSRSNLNRQLLYTPADVGKSKVACAAARLRQFNPHISVNAYPLYIDATNIGPVVKDYDIIIDCLDNLDSRLLLNDACVTEKKPFIHAGVAHLSGQVMTVIPGQSACLRCLLPVSQKKDAPTRGVIGAAAGVIGSLQALAVYKYLLSLATDQGQYVLFDGWNNRLQHLELQADPGCFCQK